MPGNFLDRCMKREGAEKWITFIDRAAERSKEVRTLILNGNEIRCNKSARRPHFMKLATDQDIKSVVYRSLWIRLC